MANEIKFFATPNQRLRALQGCPQLLAEDLLMVFGVIENERQQGVHNHIVAKIIEMCPDIDRMLLNIAKSILRTVKENEDVEKES